MTLARVLTFRDVISMVMENSVSFARLQTPLKEFLRARIMTGDLQLESALVKLLDENYSSLEEVVRVANVKVKWHSNHLNTEHLNTGFI